MPDKSPKPFTRESPTQPKEDITKYKNILFGYPIIVITGHKNNTLNLLKALGTVLC
jgi:hypothetical protein